MISRSPRAIITLHNVDMCPCLRRNCLQNLDFNGAQAGLGDIMVILERGNSACSFWSTSFPALVVNFKKTPVNDAVVSFALFATYFFLLLFLV